MNLRVACRSAMVVGSIVSVAAFAPHPKSVPVTSIVVEFAPDVAPVLQVQTDGGGSSFNSRTLASLIQPALGAWELDTRLKGATRKNLPGLRPGDSRERTRRRQSRRPALWPVPPFRILANCGLLSMTAGSTRLCDMRIGFDYNGTRYALVMNPGSAPNGPFPRRSTRRSRASIPRPGRRCVRSGNSRQVAPTSHRTPRRSTGMSPSCSSTRGWGISPPFTKNSISRFRCSCSSNSLHRRPSPVYDGRQVKRFGLHPAIWATASTHSSPTPTATCMRRCCRCSSRGSASRLRPSACWRCVTSWPVRCLNSDSARSRIAGVRACSSSAGRSSRLSS